MGIVKPEEQAYYATGGDHGSYQYLSLLDVINSFRATYVGHNKICDGVTDSDITFHALRAMQELSYDTLKSVNSWEIEVPSSLLLVMPADYVNYVKLSWSDANGIERVIYPTSKTSNPLNITTAVQDWGGFTTGGSNTDITFPEPNTSDTFDNYKTPGATTESGNDAADSEYVRFLDGNRYGLDPQHSQSNGTFFIDEYAGKFHFSSNLSGKTVILRYISDGIASSTGDNTTLDLGSTKVPKFAEEAMYKHILYGALFARKDTNPNLLLMLKKERFAETRKAKLRLSNIKLEEFTQILRGASKQIKH